MDPRDVALQAACPVVIAPRFGVLPDMGAGQRLVMASNGLFVQVKLDWLDCIRKLTPQDIGLPLPYGRVDERLSLRFGVLPIPLIEQFIEAGRQALPNEAAGVLIYARGSGRMRLALCEPIHRSPAHIDYRVPAMDADETVAVDLHTHGTLPAFWSPEDDRDDCGIKIAGVFGRLHEARPEGRFRLVINGRYEALPNPWSRAEVDSIESVPQRNTERGLLRGLLSRWHARG